jgi:hypothetical protein
VKLKILIPLLFLALLTVSAKDMGGMIIYGDGFSFTLSEPKLWEGNTQDAAKYEVNVYFVQKGYNFGNTPCLMYARVMDKGDYSVKQNLEYDMEQFKSKDKKIKFYDFDVGKLTYDYASKMYEMSNGTNDYCVYIDPGKEVKVYLIFVLTGKKEIVKQEKKTFISLLKSFNWLTASVKGIK